MLNASLKAYDPVELKCKITVIYCQFQEADYSFTKQARLCSKIFLIINTFQMKEYITQ